MELLVKINKKLEQRRAILNTIIQNVGIQNKILKSAQILAECLKLGGKIITAGNGGSASQSEHFSSEMMGRLKNSRTPFPSLSLSSNASLLTCIGNDFGFERIFSRQIEGIGTTRDVFIAFTTSCKSRNIIEALNVCKNSNPQIRNYAHHIMNWWSKSTSYPSPSFSCPVDNRQLGNNVFSLSAVLKS